MQETNGKEGQKNDENANGQKKEGIAFVENKD